ncbi:MAG: hypothetical protein ACLFNK_01785 [Candidatus Woesearchaeota archaeon]
MHWKLFLLPIVFVLFVVGYFVIVPSSQDVPEFVYSDIDRMINDGDYDRAHNMLKELSRLDSSEVTSQFLSESYVTMSEYYLEDGDYETSVDYALKSIDYDPSADSYFYLAGAYKEQNKPEKMESAALKSLEYNQNLGAYSLLFNYYFYEGEYAEAEEIIKDYLDFINDEELEMRKNHSQTTARAYGILSSIYFEQGEDDLAEDMAMKALELDPSTECYTHVAKFSVTGNLSKTKEIALETLELEPQTCYSYYYLFQAEYYLNSETVTEEASGYLDRLVEVSGNLSDCSEEIHRHNNTIMDRN